MLALITFERARLFPIKDVLVGNRIRGDLGNLDELASTIPEDVAIQIRNGQSRHVKR
jgi:hypothetical protein